MDEGRKERIYFLGLVFIKAEPYLGVDLNRGSCVEETATVMAPESKTLQKTTKHKTLHPSSSSCSSHHRAGPPPGPVKVVLFVFPPHWMPGGNHIATHQQTGLINKTIPAGKAVFCRFVWALILWCIQHAVPRCSQWMMTYMPTMNSFQSGCQDTVRTLHAVSPNLQSGYFRIKVAQLFDTDGCVWAEIQHEELC